MLGLYHTEKIYFPTASAEADSGLNCAKLEIKTMNKIVEK